METTIYIKLKDGKRVPVNAEIIGPFAVHQSHENFTRAAGIYPPWVVTHVCSHYVIGRFKNCEDARLFANKCRSLNFEIANVISKDPMTKNCEIPYEDAKHFALYKAINAIKTEINPDWKTEAKDSQLEWMFSNWMFTRHCKSVHKA